MCTGLNYVGSLIDQDTDDRPLPKTPEVSPIFPLQTWQLHRPDRLTGLTDLVRDNKDWSSKSSRCRDCVWYVTRFQSPGGILHE